MIRIAALLTATLLVPLAGPAPRDAEVDAVHRAVEDYVEALYEVKPELIERSVHPALVKRGMYRPDGTTDYRPPGMMTFAQLVDLAGSWNVGGRQGSDLAFSIEVHDVMDVTATARLTADWGVDHMQLMKRDGRWQIVHVLWQSHPVEPVDPVEAGAGR
jgi:hypothetical protein